MRRVRRRRNSGCWGINFKEKDDKIKDIKKMSRESEREWSGERAWWLSSTYPRTATSVFTFTGSKVLQGEGGQAGCHKRGE